MEARTVQPIRPNTKAIIITRREFGAVKKAAEDS